MSHLRRILASVAGSFCGFLFGSVLLLVFFWQPWRHVVLLSQALDFFYLQTIVAGALSICGWLFFLLPLALLRKYNSPRRQAFTIVCLGAVVGFALVTAACIGFFHGAPGAVFISLPYEVSAIANAVTATSVCLSLLPVKPIQ